MRLVSAPAKPMVGSIPCPLSHPIPYLPSPSIKKSLSASTYFESQSLVLLTNGLEDSEIQIHLPASCLQSCIYLIYHFISILIKFMAVESLQALQSLRSPEWLLSSTNSYSRISSAVCVECTFLRWQFAWPEVSTDHSFQKHRSLAAQSSWSAVSMECCFHGARSSRSVGFMKCSLHGVRSSWSAASWSGASNEFSSVACGLPRRQCSKSAASKVQFSWNAAAKKCLIHGI